MAITSTGKAILVLVARTGGWAIPEKGKMWRGADGSRFMINDKYLKGMQNMRPLINQQYLSILKKDWVPMMPPWMSPDRAVLQITERGLQLVESFLPPSG